KPNRNTHPAVRGPWRINLEPPQTGKMRARSAYRYGAAQIRGIKQNNHPSPWMNANAELANVPDLSSLKFKEDDRASWFSHKAEISKPYYYSVYLADADVTTEITPTERAAQFRFTFPESDSSFVVIDALDKGSYVKIIPEENKIIGYSTK